MGRKKGGDIGSAAQSVGKEVGAMYMLYWILMAVFWMVGLALWKQIYTD